MDTLPVFYVDQRRCDLAQQYFHEACELDPLSWRRLHAPCLLVEQTWLLIFGFWSHYRLSPFLIRTGESLRAHRPRHASSAGFGVESAVRRRSRNEMRLDQ